MKKLWCALLTAAILLLGAGLAYAQPEPERRVEFVKKPGVSYSQFKSLGSDISVSFSPASEWAIDGSDKFLKQRIQMLTLKAAKNQGWVTAENTVADTRLSIKIMEWGRLRNSADPNLMEVLNFEVKVYAGDAESPLVFRGEGRYRRVDPVENDLSKVAEAYGSLLEELLAALRNN